MLPTPSILVAVDIIVIAVTGGVLKVLLVQRSDSIQETRVLPGGFVKKEETLLDTARRKLREETGYANFMVHNVGTFDAIHRDSRERVLSIGFLALTHKIDFPFKDGKNTKNAQFIPIDSLPPLEFDHADIIKTTLQYLQEKVMYTDIAKPLFWKQFTLTELQTAYEAILWKELNVRNFRKKVIDIGLVIPTGEVEIGVGHRPAQYFMFA